MRRAALARLRVRRERQRIQRILIPIVFVVGPILLAIWTMYNVRQILLDFGFVDDPSCALFHHDNDLDSKMICRHAESKLWERLQPSQHNSWEVHCTLQECQRVDDASVDTTSPYALHTALAQWYIELDKVDSSGYYGSSSHRRNKPRRSDHSQVWSSLQWLGDTEVNRIVRKELFAATSTKDASSIKLLDVGCGIGGSLYPLLSGDLPLDKQLTYHGIASTKSEIHQARELQRTHQLDSSPNLLFHMHDFDQPLSNSYTAMIAIESLSYSRNLERTLKNLASSLLPKGVLIIVDDVLAPGLSSDSLLIQELRAVSTRASLLTHHQWMETLSSAGLVIQSVQDLSLTHDTPALNGPPNSSPWMIVATWRQKTAQVLHDWWAAWVGESPAKSDRASLRAIQLVQDLVQKTRDDDLRQGAFHEASLSYYMYVCTRK